MKPVTLITGASAGIGTELARVFAAHGHELVLVARRDDRLNALADEIAAGQRGPAAADRARVRSRTRAMRWQRSPANCRRAASSPISSSTMPASA